MSLAVTAALGAGCGQGGRATPGTAGVRDPYFPRLGNGGYDVTHYDLTLSWHPDARKKQLTGVAAITARATRDLTAFHLDLKGLDIADVTVRDRTAQVNRAGDEVVIRPRDELSKGATFRTVVRYSGTPQTITDPDGSREGWLNTADGALALGEPTGSMAWFPGNHHPSDKATYDLAVTVPDGLEAVSNGEPAGRRTRGGRTTFRWHTGEPMASYVATLAIGKYDVRTGRTKSGLPVITAVDPVANEAGARRDDGGKETKAGSADRELAKIPRIVEWATSRFGPYPFSSTGAVVDRRGDAGYALETQNRPVFPGTPETGLLVHELAHQWYGDSVTPKSWRDMWLNEGFATYAEWLWEEDHDGDSAQRTFDALYRGDYFDRPAENEAIWAFPPAKPPAARNISDPPVYERGAMVLHKVREAVGDKAFFRLLKGWARLHRHGNADTADFIAYAHETTGKNLDAVWGTWLYGDGKPSHP
ncbi:M1 family metallopeptidase [Streptomyces tsukubensis]|uniref:Aminopeptidase N n=1 Tax=Streptomyces tsukubensis TaxID=83656 RepID=A0A1V4A910_9ACTN|nr:M1 family metallopeptidase [Streptomyces tsukubensis]OON78762.1 metallopeptidase [Streptomyces tsukubensis]QFR94239.1 M1 family peptidase [Streptomyces tsukubensis]